MKKNLLFLIQLTVASIGMAPGISNGQPAEVEAVTYLNTLTDLSPRFDSTWLPADKTVYLHAAEDWSNWSLVENYAFGRNRGSMSMINDLGAIHPYLRDKLLTLIFLAKMSGIELAIVETFRTHAKQTEYYTMGKHYTRSKGGKSKHQFGLAVDIVPIVNGQAEWDDDALWRRIGFLGESLGLRWGGRWRSPYDPAHFEWNGELTAKEIHTGKYPTPPSLWYPCIQEDLKVLKQSWIYWEIEQQAITKR